MLNLLRWAPEIIKPTSTATATATVTAMDKATSTDQGTAKIFAIMEWLPIVQLNILKGVAPYAGLLLALAEGFGLRPRPFFALWAKKDLFMSVFAQILDFF